MRFNMPPTAGYEVHVGSKMTMAVTKLEAWATANHTRQRRENLVGQVMREAASNNTLSVHVWLQDPMCASPKLKLCDDQSSRMQRTCQHDLDQTVKACDELASYLALNRLVCHRIPQGEIDIAWQAANAGTPAMRLGTEKPTVAAPGIQCFQRAPSSALMGVLHTMRRCSEVRLFGFLLPSNGSSYFDPPAAQPQRAVGPVGYEHVAEIWPFTDHLFEDSLFMGMLTDKMSNFSIAGLSEHMGASMAWNTTAGVNATNSTAGPVNTTSTLYYKYPGRGPSAGEPASGEPTELLREPSSGDETMGSGLAGHSGIPYQIP